MTLFAYKLRVMIGALIWREENVRREDFSFFFSLPLLFVSRKQKKKKRIPRFKFLATFTHTPTSISTCKHMHGLSPFPPWRHVQGSRDHPECFALHCWTVLFSALEEGERLHVAKRWVRPFHCQHPSFTQASVSQGNSLSCPLACVCVSESVCLRMHMCVCVWGRVQVKEEHEKEKQARWLAAKPSPISSPRLIWLALVMLRRWKESRIGWCR